jgi:hypothetical protein
VFVSNQRLVFWIFLWFAPLFAEADISTCLRDLEELGYCVIPQVLPVSETEVLYRRVWHEYIEKGWPHCKMDDRSNWKETFPQLNDYGLFGGSAGQIQVMWDLRQDLRIVDIFAQIWGTSNLIVSMDGMSIMCPPEIREGYLQPWPHVDQQLKLDKNSQGNAPDSDFVSESPLKTKPFTVQGQFLFEDSFDGDGGFYCIPKSHLRFTEVAPQLEAIMSMELPRLEKRKMRRDYVLNFFDERRDESGCPYYMKHITAPRGSLILWDSRTVHWNQHPSRDRSFSHLPKVRMVGYLCYVPKARLTKKSMAIREQAFEMGFSMTANPTTPELVSNKDLLLPEFEQYLDDPSHTQSQIHLTRLGELMLGR